MNINLIDKLVEQSNEPVDDPWLEDLPKVFGNREDYYRFMYYLVEALQPAFILEIGTYFGVCAAHMAAAAASYGGQVVGIDHHPHQMFAALINDRYDNYQFILGDSLDKNIFNRVIDLVDQHGPLGLIFQDSSHHYEASHKEWELYHSLMPKGSLWVCDDISEAFHDPKVDPPGKSMVDYFNELPGEKKVYFDNPHSGNGIGVILI